MTKRDDACIFCRIAAGEAPARLVHEDANVVAFLDASPATPGHTLVVPRVHRRDLWDIADDELTYVVLVARRVAGAVRDAVGAPGMNVHQVSGAEGGQDIFHFHLHLIPRWAGDGVQPAWGRAPWHPPELDDRRLDGIAEAIRGRLAGER